MAVKKVDEKENKQAQMRVKLGENRPIEYFYLVGQSKTRAPEFVEVQQYINDKFNGMLSQQQYFPIAELSRRIYTLNQMLIERVLDDIVRHEKIKFMVQVSAKWFSSPVQIEMLTNFIEQMGERVILCFDAVTLISAGNTAKEVIKKFQKDRHIKILLDNAESQNLSLIIGYHPDYVRLDARYIDKGDESYTQVLKFLRDYLKAQNVKLVVTNIKDDNIKNYFLNNGADVVQGNGVYTPKKLLNSVIKDYNL